MSADPPAAEAWMSDDFAGVTNPSKTPGHASFIASDRAYTIRQVEQLCREAPCKSSKGAENPEFPPEFWNPGFCNFLTTYQRLCADPSSLTHYGICNSMAEKQQEDELYHCLRTMGAAFGLTLPKKRRTHTATDEFNACRIGSVVVDLVPGAGRRDSVPYAFIELESFEKAAACALHEFVRLPNSETWDMPCFIVSFAGHNLQIGALWVGRFVNIVPLTPMLHIDTDNAAHVAAALQALFESCEMLDHFHPAGRTRPEFPDARYLATLFNTADAAVDFTGAYKPSILRASVNGTHMVIKADRFTQVENQATVAALGFAPVVKHITASAVTSWKLIWMEDWGYRQWTTLDNVAKKVGGARFNVAKLMDMLTTMLNTVSEAGLIYFDVRPPNILVRARVEGTNVIIGGVALVDFELIGAPGSRWPVFDLNPDVTWPKGLRDLQTRTFQRSQMVDMCHILEEQLISHNLMA